MVRAIAIRSIFDVGLFHSLLHAGCPALSWIKAYVRFRYEGPTRLSWTQEKGDMKSVDGAWELKDLGNGRTRATYRLDADLGRVLGLLMRGPAEAALRAIFVNGRSGELQRRIEGR
jgi:hypothetical protein